MLGYYSLSMGSLARANLPLVAQRRLPNFPIPVARLARLAVARSAQGQGVGEGLLMGALVRCHALSQVIGLVAVVVDAKHERARAFYRRYTFEELPDQPLTLWLPMSSLRALLPGCR